MYNRTTLGWDRTPLVEDRNEAMNKPPFSCWPQQQAQNTGWQETESWGDRWGESSQSSSSRWHGSSSRYDQWWEGEEGGEWQCCQNKKMVNELPLHYLRGSMESGAAGGDGMVSVPLSSLPHLWSGPERIETKRQVFTLRHARRLERRKSLDNSREISMSKPLRGRSERDFWETWRNSRDCPQWSLEQC